MHYELKCKNYNWIECKEERHFKTQKLKYEQIKIRMYIYFIPTK